MPRKKVHLSLKQHVALGKELAAIRDRLGEITVQLSRAYPQSLANKAGRGQTVVDQLRSELDSVVFREHPERSAKDNAGVYYPGGRGLR